jgi:hypothetical protein
MTKSQDPRDLKPIGLTVYDLPSPEASSLEAASRTRKGRLWFFFLVMICAAPVVLSYLTYYVIRPEVKTNHGALIEPQLPLPTFCDRPQGANTSDPVSSRPMAHAGCRLWKLQRAM